MKVQLHYRIGSQEAGEALLRNPLIDLLQAIRGQGSISAAARSMGLSYRHVWGELRRWEHELGDELLVWEKGQSARLSEFGDRLLWAERQVQARLQPQIQALRSDLERALAVAFDSQVHVLTLFASHDDALATLREHASALSASQGLSALHLDIRFCGSVEAIRALNQGRCLVAGFHVQAGSPRDSLSARTYKPLLQPGQHKIIGFARRQQGLIVPPGNPLALRGLQDLARPGVRFVNRPVGSGTRVLLDQGLASLGLQGHDIAGYRHEEPSHAAVAHAVASGVADAGLGIAFAAQAAGLDFVPLVEEEYGLVCHKSVLDQPPMLALLEVLRSAAWQQRLAALPGYLPSRCGEVLSMRQLLPWWTYRRPRAARA